MIDEKIIIKIIDKIMESSRIAILPHISIDGDTLGSSLGLYSALKVIGKDVKVVVEESVPKICEFLPHLCDMKSLDEIYGDFDLVIALDSADKGRLGKRLHIFEKAKTTINIDHHPTNNNFADLNLIEADASSCGEIIYQVINKMEIKLNKSIATCIYVAIATDTGGMRFSNTTATTHEIMADLINNGADVSYISQNIFENMSLRKLKVHAYAINNIEMALDNKVAIITLTKEQIDEMGLGDDDSSGISGVLRSVSGVEVSVVLKEADESFVKGSLRSKNYIDVSKICLAFNGGGHKRAAGFKFFGNIQEIKEQIISKIKVDIK